MLAVVKTPHTEIQMKGYIAPRILTALQKEYGKQLQVLGEDEGEKVDFFSTSFADEISALMTPGEYIKIYRSNQQMSQVELGKQLGVTNAFICDLEKNRRGVSKEMAKKLAKLFGTSTDRFLI